MNTRHGRAVILSLATVLCIACAPTPLVPSGQSRMPVNTEEGINHYRERVKVEQRDRVERNGLERQVDALTTQMQELRAYVTLLQRQQQELEKGVVRQAPPVDAVSPPPLSRAPDKALRKDKQGPGAKVVPPIVARPSEITLPPRIAIDQEPTDLCGQKIEDASAYGWVGPTSHYRNRKAGLRAEHGLCRHMARSAAPSVGG